MVQNDKDGRPLTAGETRMMKEIFGIALDTTSIRIFDHFPDDPDRTRSCQIDGDIYLLGGDYEDDISKSTDWQIKATFVHEATHAWQYQKTGYCSGQEERDARFQAVDRDTAVEQMFLEYKIKAEMARHPPETHVELHKYLKEEYHKATLDSLHGVRMNAQKRIADDKSSYLWREAYDPVFTVGPRAEYEAAQTQFEWKGGTQAQLGPIGNVASADSPRPGERLSDFLWRKPSIAAAFGTKKTLQTYMECYAHEDDGSGSAGPDYNYMLRRPGAVGFMISGSRRRRNW